MLLDLSPSSREHRFILAATDYFSKWSEAVPLKEVKATDLHSQVLCYIRCAPFRCAEKENF